MAKQQHDWLSELLTRDDLTLDELTEHAHTLLAKLAPEQTRYKVAARPDARTVRYYVSQGLLAKPQSYAGGRARYSGGHLLRLLYIKKQQAEHQSLRRIAELLRGATDASLREALWPDGSGAPISIAAVAGAERIQRFALPGQAHLDVPDKSLGEPDTRRALAAKLEDLARRLHDPRFQGEDE